MRAPWFNQFGYPAVLHVTDLPDPGRPPASATGGISL